MISMIVRDKNVVPLYNMIWNKESTSSVFVSVWMAKTFSQSYWIRISSIVDYIGVSQDDGCSMGSTVYPTIELIPSH
jgi:hypothetical protein